MLEGKVALPDGWCSAVDQATGRTYYVHLESRKSSWEVPTMDSG